jgi:hypothetical protein
MKDYSAEEAAARRAALNQVYHYLLQLAAQKKAADRAKDAAHTRSAEMIDTVAMEPGVQSEFTTLQAGAQVADNGRGGVQPTVNDQDKSVTRVAGDRQVLPCTQ